MEEGDKRVMEQKYQGFNARLNLPLLALKIEEGHELMNVGGF